MNSEQFLLYLQKPELLDQSTLESIRDLVDSFPYFPAARMLYLRNLLNIKSYKFESELAQQALYIPDRRILFEFLNREPGQDAEVELLSFDNTPPEELQAVSPVDEPHSVAGDADPDELIERFIARNPSLSRLKSKPGAELALEISGGDYLDDSLITETLAGIYMKQGMYDEAIRSYKKLSLKFPEKNTYFASQIEKIKKLQSKED
ncbi:MAG TPA: hypothetical protein PLK12_06830 [Prolixibacteraceae bacterium]|nr:hypothetical protein [Prolixibacteraceae bacterium]